MSVRADKLILASRSPRRRELLAAAGYEFDVVPPTLVEECGHCSRRSPAALVARLALEKAADVARQVGGGLILGCDTVAECDGQVLGKTAEESLARRMLELLSGREHRVLSGICLWDVPRGVPEIRVAVTRLRMDRLSEPQLAEYLQSGLWEGKAGAFGYQDRQGWLRILSGSESNVVGLPLELLADMLAHRATPPDGVRALDVAEFARIPMAQRRRFGILALFRYGKMPGLGALRDKRAAWRSLSLHQDPHRLPDAEQERHL